MTVIAHLSDVHALASKVVKSHHDLQMRFLSLGRALDVARRKAKLAAALASAAHTADHVVVSGDLTEVGLPEQFEAFAEILHDARIPSERIVLVPGNHDAYAERGAFARALEGPLAPWRAGAAANAGKVVDRGDVVFLPLDVACHQPVTRSAGELGDADAEALGRRLSDPGLARRHVVIVLHHPPFARSNPAWQWIDGLRGARRLMDILARHGRANVMHGHLHYPSDRVVGEGRIVGAPAVVSEGTGPGFRAYAFGADGLVDLTSAERRDLAA